MAAVRLLSDNLINKIAAGEVVERPASALKEIIENSIDAGATRIEIEAEAGGRKMMSVSDNGSGMSPDDLLLSVERHATSKLSEETDLLSVATMGFRGEALASIASVSRIIINTAVGDDGVGKSLRISGGKLMAVDEISRVRGTTVEIRDIFFNVPARRKFLKTVQTEAAHLTESVQRYALGNPELRLTYKHNGQVILSVSPSEEPLSRVANVLGRDIAKNMFAFKGEAGDLSLSGFLGRPALTRSRSDGIYLYVNSRPVMDRLLLRAVHEAFQGRLMTGRYPYAIISLEIDPQLVDVNVHPAKAQVRFRQPGQVMAAARDIMAGRLAEDRGPLPVHTPKPRPLKDAPITSYREIDTSVNTPSVAETALWDENAESAFVSHAPASQESQTPDHDFMPMREAQAPGPLTAVGQIFRSYILAQGSDGLYIIDHHAAHERILFEQFKDELSRGRLPGQALLLPLTIELAPVKAVRLEGLMKDFIRLGFDVEHFGGQTFVIRAIPAILSGKDPQALVLEIIDEMEEASPKAGLEAMEDTLLKSLACHGSVRAGESLTLKEMDRIITDLHQTKLPTHCPHGRPLLFHIGLDEIRKKFRRT